MEQVALHPPGAPVAAYRYLVGYAPPNVVINEFLADNASVNQDESVRTVSNAVSRSRAGLQYPNLQVQ